MIFLKKSLKIYMLVLFDADYKLERTSYIIQDDYNNTISPPQTRTYIPEANITIYEAYIDIDSIYYINIIYIYIYVDTSYTVVYFQ